jgi:hypothetical protein
LTSLCHCSSLQFQIPTTSLKTLLIFKMKHCSCWVATIKNRLTPGLRSCYNLKSMNVLWFQQRVSEQDVLNVTQFLFIPPFDDSWVFAICDCDLWYINIVYVGSTVHLVWFSVFSVLNFTEEWNYNNARKYGRMGYVERWTF